MAAKFAQLTESLAGRAFRRRTPSRHTSKIGSFNAMPWSERRSGGAWARATMPGTLAAITPAPMTQPCSSTFRREMVMAGLLVFRYPKFDQNERVGINYHLTEGCKSFN